MQFVLSGSFLWLLASGIFLLGGGYYLYRFEQRRHAPPYYTTKATTVIKACLGCVLNGHLKGPAEWRFGKALRVSAEDKRWFTPVGGQGEPVKLDGLVMLPVYPAYDNNPQYGFDHHHVFFVLLQDLEPRQTIEQLPASPPLPAPVAQSVQPSAGLVTPPPPQLPVETPSAPPEGPPPPVPVETPVSPPIVSSPTPPVLVALAPPAVAPPAPVASRIMRLGPHLWRVELTVGDGWFDTHIPLIAGSYVRIYPEPNTLSSPSQALWAGQLGNLTFHPERVSSGAGQLVIHPEERDSFVSGPGWLDTVSLKVTAHDQPTLALLVDVVHLAPEITFRHTPTHGGTEWGAHIAAHAQARRRAETLVQQVGDP